MSFSQNEKSIAIKHLDKALSDSHFDKEEAYNLLREADFNPENIVERHTGRIKKMQVQLEIERSKSKRAKLDLVQLAIKQMEKFRGKFQKDPKYLLKEFYQNEIAFQYRSLEEISADDALEMLEEAQLLKLIKELEKNNNG